MPDAIDGATAERLGYMGQVIAGAALKQLAEAWQAGRDAGATDMLHTATVVHMGHEQPIRDAARAVLFAHRELDRDPAAVQPMREALAALQEALGTPVRLPDGITFADIARMRQALLWIEPVCSAHTSGTCYGHRTPDARYSADRWCDGCIAAHGLGVDPDRAHQTNPRPL